MPVRLRPPGGIAIDYTARDYDGLCAMMKARITKHIGGDAAATLAHAADPLATLVEALAYLGDQLAFRQDAAGTEAYLPTARSRISLRRHARLRDYAADDGACARTFLAFSVDGDDVLPPGLAVVTRQPGRPHVVLDAEPPLAAGTTVFETCERLPVGRALNDLGPGLVRETAYVLEAGACTATLSGLWLSLRPGMLLVLRQRVAPAGGRAFGSHALRLLAAAAGLSGTGLSATTELRWHPEDALPALLTVPLRGDTGAVELLGNVALADHGRTLPEPVPLDPPVVPAHRGFRPSLHVADPVYACPVSLAHIQDVLDAPLASLVLPSAAALLTPDPSEAVAALAIREVQTVANADPRPPPTVWRPVRDLLSAPSTARLFSVAPERVPGSGPCSLVLGFGDGGFGFRPEPGTRFEAVVRSGGGVSGQVDADALNQVIGPALRVIAVTNPLPARPALPETDAAIRLLAATGYQAQERGITPEDWERLALRDPLVVSAVARERDGTGPCTIGLELRDPDEAGLWLVEARLFDLAVLGAPPIILPARDAFLDAALVAYCRPGADIGAARARLAQAFGPGRRRDGTPAFLAPVLWPPGRDAELAAFVAEVARDPAVVQVVNDPAVDPRIRFGLYDATASGATFADKIVLGPHRRLRAGNDPLRPEAGRFVLYLAGSP